MSGRVTHPVAACLFLRSAARRHSHQRLPGAIPSFQVATCAPHPRRRPFEHHAFSKEPGWANRNAQGGNFQANALGITASRTQSAAEAVVGAGEITDADRDDRSQHLERNIAYLAAEVLSCAQDAD